MSSDFWSTFSFVQVDPDTQRQAIDALLDSRQSPPALTHLAIVSDWMTRIQLLAQAWATEQKDYAHSGTRQSPGGLLDLCRKAVLNQYLQRQTQTYLQPLGLQPSLPPLAQLPRDSFALRLRFRLRTPYLSKDDRDFHLLDNPVKKEWVFQVPYVAAPSWKGALRAAMLQQLVEWWDSLDEVDRQQRHNRKRFVAKRLQLARLFGSERDVLVDDSHFDSFLDKVSGEHLARWYRRVVRRFISANGFFAGRLYIYPTFFDAIGLEVINPHDRKTGAGRQPIYLECVPAGAAGDLTVLYVPLATSKQREGHRRMQVAEDMEVLADGVRAMLTIYGFGAKTSDSFGSAEDRLADRGTLAIYAELPDIANATGAASESKKPVPNLPRYLETPARLHSDLRRPDGSLRSEAEYEAFLRSRGGQYGKRHKQLYEKAQNWWEREGRQMAEAAAQVLEPEPAPTSPPKPPVTEEAFGTLTDLVRKAAQLAAH